jgi:hypothetical protein
MKPPRLSTVELAKHLTRVSPHFAKQVKAAAHATKHAPKLFWYCRPPNAASWRYLPADRPGVREYPGRLVIRENVNGKRVYVSQF